MVFLGLMGFVLDRAFQRSAEQAVQEKLLIHIYGLLAVSDESDGELFLPDELQEPQFNSLGSGLYGLVMAAEGQELWQSPSALDLQLGPDHKVTLHANLEPGKQRFGRLQDKSEDSRRDSLFYLSYKIRELKLDSSSDCRRFHAGLIFSQQHGPPRTDITHQTGFKKAVEGNAS